MQRPPGGDNREGDEISVAAPQQISISEGRGPPCLLYRNLFNSVKESVHGKVARQQLGLVTSNKVVTIFASLSIACAQFGKTCDDV